MDKIVIYTLPIVPPTQVYLFEILLPENYPSLIGISTSVVMGSGDVYRGIGIGGVPDDNDFIGGVLGGGLGLGGRAGSNTPIGLLRLFMADDGDELFSEAVFNPSTKFPFEMIGQNFTTENIPIDNSRYIPLETKLKSEKTLINGFYRDRASTDYQVLIYLHFENQIP